MVKFDSMPKPLQTRVAAAMGLKRTGKPPFVAEASARAAWDELDGKAQAQYLGTVNAQLLEEAAESVQFQQKALL
jgi:hypothetical protein